MRKLKKSWRARKLSIATKDNRCFNKGKNWNNNELYTKKRYTSPRLEVVPHHCSQKQNEGLSRPHIEDNLHRDHPPIHQRVHRNQQTFDKLSARRLRQIPKSKEDSQENRNGWNNSANDARYPFHQEGRAVGTSSKTATDNHLH